MPDLKFEVLGSAGDVYEVIFSKFMEKLSVSCTCKAGQMGTYCNHRIKLIEGDYSGVLRANPNDLKGISALVKGTRLEAALNERAELLSRKEKLEREIKIANAAVASLMSSK